MSLWLKIEGVVYFNFLAYTYPDFEVPCIDRGYMRLDYMLCDLLDCPEGKIFFFIIDMIRVGNTGPSYIVLITIVSSICIICLIITILLLNVLLIDER